MRKIRLFSVIVFSVYMVLAGAAGSQDIVEDPEMENLEALYDNAPRLPDSNRPPKIVDGKQVYSQDFRGKGTEVCQKLLSNFNYFGVSPMEMCHYKLQPDSKDFRLIDWQEVSYEPYLDRMKEIFEETKNKSSLDFKAMSWMFHQDFWEDVEAAIKKSKEPDGFPVKMERAVITVPNRGGDGRILIALKFTFRPCEPYEFPSLFFLNEKEEVDPTLSSFNYRMNVDGGDLFFYKGQLLHYSMKRFFGYPRSFNSVYINDIYSFSNDARVRGFYIDELCLFSND